jgi:hypothetical protein
MFSPKVILWGGVASICAGLFYIMSGLAPNGGGFVIALVLSLGGLVSLYSRLAGQGGGLGLAGFALGVIGMVLVLATLWWGSTSGLLSPTIVGRELAPLAQVVLILFLAFVTIDVGLLLLGVASLRAKILHRWQGVPMGLGLLGIVQCTIIWFVYYLPLSQGQNPWNPWDFTDVAAGFVYIPLGIGWIMLGSTLATEADPQVTQFPLLPPKFNTP